MVDNVSGGSSDPSQWDISVKDEVEHPRNIDLLAYYQVIRAGRDMPSRADLDLRKLKSLMSGLLLVERTSDLDLRFRVTGSGIERRLGTALTGRTAKELFEPRIAEGVRSYFAHVIDDGERRIMRGHFQLFDIAHVDYELLLLPLRSNDGKKVWVLGGMFAFN